MYVGMYASMRVSVHVSVRVCEYACMYVSVHVSVHVSVRVCGYATPGCTRSSQPSTAALSSALEPGAAGGWECMWMIAYVDGYVYE